MKTKSFIFILCFVVFLFSFSNEEEITQISNDKPNFVKSLVQTTDYLKLQVNSPMKLAEYTASKNDKNSLIKSISKDIIFIPNKGQIIDSEGKLIPDILYKAELGGVDLYLTNKGMSFVFYKYEDIPNNLAAGNKEMDKLHDPFREDMKNKTVKMYRMDLNIIGMNRNVKTLNEEQTTEYFNYYYAHCPDGITNVHGYRKVIFENIYNNIDLVYYSNEKGLKYDFIVKPGGNVADIKLKYENENEVYITEEDKIRAFNPFGELETDVLLTYQSDGKEVESNYKIDADGTISINTNEYDKSKILIIDPYIGATYYGGSISEWGYSITTDGTNNILITGWTYGGDFPLFNPGGGAYFQNISAGYVDIFILKFNNNGIHQWATLYGGSDLEVGYSITSGRNNNIILTGYTKSTDLPLYNPGGGTYFQGLHGGGTTGSYFDSFIIKFTSGGVRQWATYYGGNGSDIGHSIKTDVSNNILVTGETTSTNLSLQNPGGGAYFQNSLEGYSDAFILKFSQSGIRQWATYYGGIYGDIGNSITTDSNSNILITGKTNSHNFPRQNPGGGAYFQNTNAGYDDAFILKFNSTGVRLWATFYGGDYYDQGNSITIDANNNMLIVGVTLSYNFPVFNPGGGAYFQGTYTGGWGDDIFILKFNSNGVRQWATYYGGYGIDVGHSISSDSYNNILVTGVTHSSNLPTYNPGGNAYYQDTNGTSSSCDPLDLFILKFNSNGVRYWATYYGAFCFDRGYSITTDLNNNIFITGETNSYNFPVFDPGGGAYFQDSLRGNSDAFILGFKPSGVIGIPALSTSIPNEYKLHQNYPNPFNPTTNIRFDLQKSSYTKLIVYDILGKEISTLVNEKLSAGSYKVEWNATGYPSGVYFYKIVTNDFVDVKKMLLIK